MSFANCARIYNGFFREYVYRKDNMGGFMKRQDIHKVLIIGSGPIIIGQACEFDYSGTRLVRH